MTFNSDSEEDGEEDQSFAQIFQGEESEPEDDNLLNNNTTMQRPQYRIPRRNDFNIANFSSLLKDSIVAGVTTAMAAMTDSSDNKRKREEEDSH